MIYEAYCQYDTERPGLKAGTRFIAAALTEEEAMRRLEDRRYHHAKVDLAADDYWVDAVEPRTDFVPPPWPAVRELYGVEIESVPSKHTRHWGTTNWRIIRKSDGALVYEFARNYPAHKPFEVFRQGDRTFALIAPNYTATTVVDLDKGEIVASEQPAGEGFCPVGFYVPDYWDVHDGSMIPGSYYWSREDEKPDGRIGFVWGCHWGDDGSWKVQHLDLSRVTEGVITRDDRYGYTPLAMVGDDPRPYIQYVPGDDDASDFVTFAVEQHFRVQQTDDVVESVTSGEEST